MGCINLFIGYFSETMELRNILQTADGRTFVASKQGGYQASKENTLIAVAALNSEVRLLEQLSDGRIFAAA